MIPAPITANAATAKVVGIGKTFTIKKTTKVSGLSKAEKKIVKVTVNKKKRTVTVKGLKAGKATFKIGKKAYTVKVGATSITKKTVTTNMTAGETKTLSVNAVNGKGDTIQFTSSKKGVVKVNKASAKANAKKVASTTVTAVAAGTAKITAKSKFTGKSKTFTIKVEAAAPAATNAPTVATTPGITTPTATVAATKAPSVATTPAVQTTAPAGTDAPEATTGAATTAPAESTAPSVTETPDVTTTPNITGTPDVTETPNVDVTTAPAITTAPAATATPAAVEITAKQTGRNTITVTGEALSANVDDYTVTRGKSTLTVSEVIVSEDKTTADIKLASSSMSAGEYSVTYNDATCTLTAEVEAIDSIVIVGTSLVAQAGYDATDTNNDSATIGYKVLNQFGERMADNGTDINIMATCTLDTDGVTITQATRTSDGVLTVDVPNGVIGTTVGSLVLVDTKSGKNVSAVVTLSSSAKVAKVDVAGIYDTTTGEVAELTSGISSTTIGNYGILLKAYDQYGNSFSTFNGSSGNVTVTVSGNAGIDITAADWGSATKVTVDDEDYICLPFALKSGASATTVGTSVVTIVGNESGLLASVKVDVKKAVKVADFSVSPTDTLYYNSKTEMEYKALDSEGNTVTDYNKLNNDTNVNAVLNSDFTWERQSDGSAKLYFTPSATTFTASGDQTTLTGRTKDSVNSTINTSIESNVHVTTIKVYAQKRCTKINGLASDVAKAAVLSDSITYTQEDFIIEDQYGNTMTADEVGLDTDASIKAYSDTDTNAFTNNLNSTPVTKAISGTTTQTIITLTAASTKANAGSETITFSLLENSNAIASSEFTTTVKSTDIENVTNFAISDIKTLYVDPDSKAGASNSSTWTNNSTSVPFKVTGKYGNLTVEIPNTSYNVNLNGDMLSYATGTISVVGTGDLGTGITDTSAEFEVAIKNEAGTAITKKVDISNIAPEVAEVKKASVGQLSISSKSVGSSATVNYATDIAPLLTVSDQYAGYEAGFAGAVVAPKVLFTNIPDGITVTDNNTTTATLSVAGATANTAYTVNVTLTYPSGVTFTDTIVINTVA